MLDVNVFHLFLFTRQGFSSRPSRTSLHVHTYYTCMGVTNFLNERFNSCII